MGARASLELAKARSTSCIAIKAPRSKARGAVDDPGLNKGDIKWSGLEAFKPIVIQRLSFIRETLENPARLRENEPVIADQD